jgi:hypothetical protein
MQEPNAVPNGLAQLPEVDATIARLSGLKQVKGVLILHRPSGSLLRSAGPLFSSSSLDEQGLTAAQAYGEQCWALVESMAAIFGKGDEGPDAVKFTRLRVRKLEWIITPGSFALSCAHPSF